MQRIHAAVMVTVSGLFVSWLGQGIWRNSPDQIWAAAAVIAVLSAGAIVLERRISVMLSAVTRVKPRGRVRHR